LSFNPFLHSYLKNGPEKSLSRETCLDLKLRNNQPVRKPVFSRRVAEPRFSVNNYTSGNCYLLDILAVGDSALRDRDPQIGWLRDIFQYPRVIKFFWGGVSDTANLFASYEISVAGFIDLQVVESQYRQRLIKLTNGQQDPTKKHPLGLEAAYECKIFIYHSILKYYIRFHGQEPDPLQARQSEAQNRLSRVEPSALDQPAFELRCL
jgi:hypothetical protein